MMSLTQLEAVRPLLDQWNAELERSRREYAAHPIVSCLGILYGPEGDEWPCERVRNHRDHLCNRCRTEAAWARYLAGR
jgi:hypothetical protein